MKVICDKLIDEISGKAIQSSSWLTKGKTYLVLSVSFYAKYSIEYRLLSDDSMTPALYSAKQFQVIDSEMPKSWIYDSSLGDYIELTPKPWSKPGFWEEYFDGEPEAVQIFNTELAKIIKE